MKQSLSNTKFFGLFLIVSSITCLGLWYRYEFKPITNLKAPIHKESKKTLVVKSELQVLWENDIKKMKGDNIFHKEIKSLNRVRVFLLDQNLHNQFKNLKAPFQFHKKGRNLLEVSFMSHHSEIDNKDKLILQYNLVDKITGNMFWEHSRTITLPETTLSQ